MQPLCDAHREALKAEIEAETVADAIEQLSRAHIEWRRAELAALKVEAPEPSEAPEEPRPVLPPSCQAANCPKAVTRNR